MDTHSKKNMINMLNTNELKLHHFNYLVIGFINIEYMRAAYRVNWL